MKYLLLIALICVSGCQKDPLNLKPDEWKIEVYSFNMDIRLEIDGQNQWLNSGDTKEFTTKKFTVEFITQGNINSFGLTIYRNGKQYSHEYRDFSYQSSKTFIVP